MCNLVYGHQLLQILETALDFLTAKEAVLLTNLMWYLMEQNSQGSAHSETQTLRYGHPKSNTVSQVMHSISKDDHPHQWLDAPQETTLALPLQE